MVWKQPKTRHIARRSMVLLGVLLVLAWTTMSCSSASKELRFKRHSSAPSVVYVAEQVTGLEEWVRGPESRTYAQVYTREGDTNEGQLLRITNSALVIGKQGQTPLEIARNDVLFMRVWW